MKVKDLKGKIVLYDRDLIRYVDKDGNMVSETNGLNLFRDWELKILGEYDVIDYQIEDYADYGEDEWKMTIRIEGDALELAMIRFNELIEKLKNSYRLPDWFEEDLDEFKKLFERIKNLLVKQYWSKQKEWNK